MRKLTLNMFLSALYKIVLILTGLAVQRYLLAFFGSEINGLTSAIAQLLSFLTLLEAGIGAATASSLHKPLADGDIDKTSSLISACGQMYRRAGLWFLCFLAVISLILPFVVSGGPTPFTVFLLTIFTGIGSILSYLFVGKFTPLLTADGRIGVLYIIDTITVLCSCGIRISMMRSNIGILAVQAVVPICAALKAVVVFLYVKKRYFSVNYRANPDTSLKSGRRSAMVHQMVGLAVNHTDVTILTLFSSLRSVSLYSVYSYIYSSIATLFDGAFMQAVIGYFGRLAAKGRDSFNRAFTVYQSVYTAILSWVLSTALVLTLPFISVYTQGVTDTEYINPTLAVLFCLTAFLNLARIPYILAVNVYGYFKETERSAIVECAVNLAVSIILFPFWGMRGLLIGTAVAYLLRGIDTVIFVCKKCTLPIAPMLRTLLGCLTASAVVILIFFVLFPISAASVLEWVLKATGLTLCSALLFAAVSLLFNGKVIIAAIKRHI